ncbi:MAG: hypothetical protein M1823_003133 [Watsoniomyces obsoletus]|nr:MAG: hypothetical protein M1823_003133 [Watsoniomyces obsoletus]
MALLTHLPDDLLWMIVDLFEETGDVSNLSYVCKTLRRVAERSLYRKMIWMDLFIGGARMNPGGKPRLHLLLRSMLARKELAHYVKELGLVGDMPKSVKTTPNTPLTADVIDPAIELVRTAALPYEERWIEGLRQGNLLVYLALLLSQLSSLQTLTLDATFQYDSRFIGMIFQRMLVSSDSSAAAPMSKGDQLRQVWFLNAFRPFNALALRRTINLHQNLALLYLPSIETIKVRMSEPEKFTWPGGRARPSASTLTDLCVDASQLPPADLGEILQATPNLKKLTYEVYAYPDPDRPFNYFDCEELGRALESVRLTLEDLNVSIDFDVSSAMEVDEAGGSWERGGTWGIKGSLGNTLRSFTKLQTLSIPLVVLLGWVAASSKTTSLADVLPRQPLRRLALTADLRGWRRYEWTNGICQSLIVDYLLHLHGDELTAFEGYEKELKTLVPAPYYKNWEEEWAGDGDDEPVQQEEDGDSTPSPSDAQDRLAEACAVAGIDATEFGVFEPEEEEDYY